MHVLYKLIISVKWVANIFIKLLLVWMHIYILISIRININMYVSVLIACYYLLVLSTFSRSSTPLFPNPFHFPNYMMKKLWNIGWIIGIQMVPWTKNHPFLWITLKKGDSRQNNSAECREVRENSNRSSIFSKLSQVFRA